ncbi:ABC-type Na+ efflux pump, permease component [Candidatus Methanoperedens nitroreducens]|uniref:ABC-type Na+ efflux pump, permease component n=1 Tax=Candidatus Methanoperedens nitratireducens TaxID=1392998 RepID=A0A062V318_9EURY|nr:ABC transporter permease [Candidatus Methanoperedens nitroreducens]KCZ71762.1 ABC-type Na+ efflux pump, permease component [Candidatus Methanoperedens nitroreducens]MDJ1422265.1 ABC transporter permease [Candidatus Methanoperedens sp.]
MGSSGNTLVITKKEMRSLLNEKTLILAVIIQLMIASFSSLLVIGLSSFFDPSALDRYDIDRVKVGIIGEGELKRFIEKSKVKPYYYEDLDSALLDFNNNRIDAVLVFPTSESSSNEIIQILLYLPKSDIKGTFVTLQLKKPLEEFEAFVRDVRGPRIGFEPVRLYVDEAPKKTSTYFEFIYGILIPLLVLTPVFISGSMVIDMLTEEYERRTMELLLVSPLSFSEILNGKMLAAVLLVPAQVFLWLVLVSLSGIEVNNIGIILLLTTAVSVIIILIGAVIAVRYKERVISQYLYSLILILLFMAGYLFADSPFNLITRLSSGAAGAEALIYCGVYAAVAVPLYAHVTSSLP